MPSNWLSSALYAMGMAVLKLREQIAEGFGGGFRCGLTGEDEFGMISFDIMAYVLFCHEVPFPEISPARGCGVKSDRWAFGPGG